jgi:hypothetical protein
MRLGAAPALAALVAMTACKTERGGNMVASYSGMSDTQFTVEAVAPPDVIREYAICKAVWLAEKKGATTISLSNPEYAKPRPQQAVMGPFPPEWLSVRATAYLTEPNPSGNPNVSVADYAAQCRRGWDWYR